jgi:hypothetical protein
MAIDTRDRRASCLMLGLPFGHVWPMPDGAITAADFEQESYLYRGISSGGPIGPALPGETDSDIALSFFFSDRPSRARFIDGLDDPTEAIREGTRATQGRPRRPPELI